MRNRDAERAHTALCLLDAASELLGRAENEAQDSALQREVLKMQTKIRALIQGQLRRYDAEHSKEAA